MVLKQLFPDFMTEGAIFTKMLSAPWYPNSNGLDLDISYIGMWSGDKQVSKFVRYFIKDNVLDSQKLADTLWTIYGNNWKRQYDAIIEEYKPIDNYAILEKVTRASTNDRITNRNVSTTDTEKSTDGTVDKSTATDNSTTTNSSKGSTTEDETTTVTYGKVDQSDGTTDTYNYGFNSVEKVPTASSTETSKNTQSGDDKTTRNSTGTTENNGTTTTEGTGSVDRNVTQTTDGTKTGKTVDDTTDNKTESETISRTREGNIGQTSYQDLLRQELELRKWNFYKQVFSDCDVYLTLSVFTCSYGDDNCAIHI